MKIHTIKNLSELKIFAKDFVDTIKINNKEQAKVIALSGDLGAGKTTLVQHLAKELGIFEVVTSPTFTIMKIYPMNNQNFKRLVHIDAYRIESLEELRPLRLSEILADKENLVCIEWAERISPILPRDITKIEIKTLATKDREITISEA